PDLDLQDGGILGAADGGEGAATAPAVALGAGDLTILDDGGQVSIVAAARPRPAALLAAWPAAWGLGAVRSLARGGGGGGFGLAAEELLLAETHQGFEFGDPLFKACFALDGALVLGLPAGGLPPGLRLLGALRGG